MYFMDVYMHITSSFSSVSLLGKLYLCVRSFNFAFQFRADVHCKQWHSACLQCVHLKRCVCVMLHWQKYSNVTQHTNKEIISFRLIEQLDGRWVLKRIRCFFCCCWWHYCDCEKVLKNMLLNLEHGQFGQHKNQWTNSMYIVRSKEKK